MIRVTFDPAQVASIKKILGETSKGLSRELATVVNKTAKKVKTLAARDLKTELNVPVKILKKVISTKNRANKEIGRAHV